MEKAGTTRKKRKILLTICFFILFIACTAFFLHEFFAGHFSSVDSLNDYIASYGAFAPLMLTLFQCIKVPYAIIPGAIGCIAGAGMFGTLGGFICNYVGICSGSLLAFALSRRYGINLVQQVFSKKKYDSCVAWIERQKRSYPVFLWIAIFLPISPDDFLCYFTGLTNMSFRKFAIIILTAKPWAILMYSLIFGQVL